MSKSYLTKEGLKKLREEHDFLVNKARPQIAQDIKTAIDSGGYEDNTQYDIELEKRDQIEQKIAELEDLLRSSQVIDENEDSKFVRVGSIVIVEVDGEVDSFKIVGSFEADPVKNLISNESPVGQAILGTKAGDVVEVSTPVVKLKYKILEIKHD
ncbi:MAG: transcription elongation factor GreA [Patescibacteria group bacterium]